MNASKTSIAKTQLVQASVLGTMAFKNGLKSAPYCDAELMKLIENRSVGQTPKGEASTTAIMKAWTNAWHNANLAN